MNFPFSFWISTGSGEYAYTFENYGTAFDTTCKNSVKSQISFINVSDIGSDNKLILRELVDRLRNINNINNSDSFDGGTTSIKYNVEYTYTSGIPSPNQGDDGESVFTFTVKKHSDNSLVSSGTLTFLESTVDISENYIIMNVTIAIII